MTEPQRLYLIDGSGFIFRAYHSLPPLTRADGTPVGAVYGFTTMLLKLRAELQANMAAVIFDHARETFRHALYADYKANRPPAPEDLIPQFALVREAAEALSFPQMEVPGFEADDVIATLAVKAAEKGIEVVIVSSDKDLMQLIRPGITMLDPMKQKKIAEAEVLEKFGVTPDKVIEVQALIGDSVDHVPGVPGIGPKTAAELIQAYGSLEGVLAHVHDIKQPKRREALMEHAEKARLSRKLVELHCDVPLTIPCDELHLEALSEEKLSAFLQAQNFMNLLGKLQKKWGVAVPVASSFAKAVTPVAGEAAESAIDHSRYVLVQTEAQLREWVEKAQQAGVVAFDTETTSLDATQAQLVGVSLAIAPNEACYIPVGHVGAGGGHDLLEQCPTQISLSVLMAQLKPLLESPAVLKVAHNAKYDMLVLQQHGVKVSPVDDTMLISYLLDGAKHRHGMDELSVRHLGMTPISFAEVIATAGKGANFSQVALEKACSYAAEDADVTLRLYKRLKPRLREQKMVSLYERIERPLIDVLAAMEGRGIVVDKKVLEGLSQKFGERMAVLEAKAYEQAGQQFNLGSPKQLGEILFEVLSLPGGKKNKSGGYTTDADVLEDLAAQGHVLPETVLGWRQMAKLRNTYTEALQKQIHPKDKRVHTSYAMTMTSTGRLSSNEPNLQNIPIRTEDGRSIRTAFIAAPGHVLLSADYSQIELRLLAHMANIPALQEALKSGQDIHSLTASQVFGIPLAEVDGEARRRAKAVNFGIIYGMSAFGLASRLGIPRHEGAAIIEAYFAQFPGIKEFMEHNKAFAREHGYVLTLYGRRCYVPGINDRNAALRALAERAAINAPLQGTAADIIKKAMISTYRRLQEVGLPQAMLLQVHDELVLEVPEERAEEITALVRREMESVAALSVPLSVEVGKGPNWEAAH